MPTLVLAGVLAIFNRGNLMTLGFKVETQPAREMHFVFDNQVLAQCIYLHARIGEVSCPTRYFPEASSINLHRSTVYGLGVLQTTVDCIAARLGLYRKPIFNFPPLQLKQQDSQVFKEVL